MARVRITKGKLDGINRLADARGVIAAAAMDQRGSLRRAIAQARGGQEASAADLTAFKTAVAQVLTPYASAILLDPEYGLPALQRKDPRAGVLLAYEETGYDPAVSGRLPHLLRPWSVRRLIQAGAAANKVLLYYNPFAAEQVNTIKHALIERVGAECAAHDVPFFLELVTYDDTIGDTHGFAFARRKPALVTGSTAEFTQPQYGIDVLKVEVPVNLPFVQGTQAFAGTAAYSRQEALQRCREAAAAATKPLIYLSGGATNPVFLEALALAAEAGVTYAGVLCGRATWQDGIAVYAVDGTQALEAWLADQGVKNISALNAVLAKGAKPWWTVYDGKENVELVG